MIYHLLYHLHVSAICEGHSLRDIDCGYIPEHPAAAQVDPLRPHRELAGVWSACEDGPQDSLLSEDYSKWKEQVIRAFVQNRVAKDDKLVKLREVLKGHAKKLVPFSMTASIDDAWITLDKAF